MKIFAFLFFFFLVEHLCDDTKYLVIQNNYS